MPAFHNLILHTNLFFAVSQPTAGLQIFLNGGWKYVRHYPNAILVNLGDAMEFTTGGLLKAAVHRGMVISLALRKVFKLNIICSYFTNLKFTNLHPTRGSKSRYLYKNNNSNSPSSVPRFGLFYFATMLPEVILRPLDSLASRAQPLTAGIFDEFGGETPTAGGESFPLDTLFT